MTMVIKTKRVYVRLNDIDWGRLETYKINHPDFKLENLILKMLNDEIGDLDRTQIIPSREMALNEPEETSNDGQTSP
jgi:hypothetical protein